jgi:hypothetical protein
MIARDLLGFFMSTPVSGFRRLAGDDALYWRRRGFGYPAGMKKRVNIRALSGLIAVVALGAAIGFLWRKLERAAVEPAQQAAADPAAATNPVPAAADPPAQVLAERLRTSINAGNPATGSAPAMPGPAELLRRADLRQQLMRIHPDFAEELELTPEEAGQFFDLLARQQLQVAELIAAHQGANPGKYPQGLLNDIRTMELAGDSEQAAALGSKYPLWVQHQEALLQRNPLEQLQGVLMRQGSGFASDRADQMGAALAAEQKRLNQNLPHAAQPPDNDPQQQLQEELRYSLNNRQQLLKVASAYLDSQQLESYGQVLEERARIAQRLLRRMEAETGD